MAVYNSVNDVINAIIAIEKAENGYLEKATNANLDSKTGNAGYNNYTKYWRDLNQFGLMGQASTFSGGPAWAWCAGFQTWSFIKAVGIELTKKLLLHIPFITCATLGEMSRAAGQLFSDPKVGDVVLFHNGSRFSHTAYVYAVDASRFYTIEGNTNASSGVVPNGGGVCMKSYVISTMKNKGTKFHRPNYSLAVNGSGTSSNTTTSKPATSTTTSTKPSTATSGTVTVTTKNDPLNCRRSASGDSVCLGKFLKGTVLTLVKKTNNNWWKVKGVSTTGKTITGYCSAKYLSENGAITSASSKYVTVITQRDPLNCRATPASNGTVLGKFAKGSSLNLIKKTNSNWWTVKGKATSGKVITGYCSTRYLS